MGDDTADFDALLQKLANAPAAHAAPVGGNDNFLNMFMLMMKMDREDRARAEERRSELLNTILTALPAVVAPLFQKKEMDPLLLEVIRASISGKGANEQFAQAMDLMRQSAAQTLEQTRASMLQVMETKDRLMERALEKAEAGDAPKPSGSPAAELIREVRLGLQAMALAQGGPAPADGPAVESGPTPPGVRPPDIQRLPAPEDSPQRPPPVVAVLRALRNLQMGQVPKEKLPMLRASLVTTIIQDEELTACLLDDDTDTATQRAVDYCLPFITSDPALLGWIKEPGVALWLGQYVTTRLIPLVGEAVLDDEEMGEPEPAGDADGTPPPVEPSPAV